MNDFRRIKQLFDAAAAESGETPLSDAAPTVQPTPRVQRTSEVRPKSTNARSSTAPRSGPNIAKAEPRPAIPGPANVRPGAGDILIAVMGVTGSGKSHFCRAATGDDDIDVGDGLESCNFHRYPFEIYVY